MPRGVPLSDEDRDRVRRRIFRHASQLFLRQGFHETSMRQVARAAGMGKTTLYDYFPGKEEILLFFVEKLLDVTHVAAAEIGQMELPAPEKLRRILRSLWSVLEQNRGMAVLVSREASRLSDQATRRMALRREKYRSLLEVVIRQGIQEGSLRPVSPELAALAIHSMMTMPFYDWLLRGRRGDAGPGPEALVDLILRGIEAT